MLPFLSTSLYFYVSDLNFLKAVKFFYILYGNLTFNVIFLIRGFIFASNHICTYYKRNLCGMFTAY